MSAHGARSPSGSERDLIVASVARKAFALDSQIVVRSAALLRIGRQGKYALDGGLGDATAACLNFDLRLTIREARQHEISVGLRSVPDLDVVPAERHERRLERRTATRSPAWEKRSSSWCRVRFSLDTKEPIALKNIQVLIGDVCRRVVTLVSSLLETMRVVMLASSRGIPPFATT